MKIELPEKWIKTATSGEAVSDVAVRTLQNRLGAVFVLLPLASEKANEDTEYIHQLRVWTRRATAALNLYEDLMPHRISSWVKKQLKRIRNAANDARDCDILIAQLREKNDTAEVDDRLEELRQERDQAQEAAMAVYERMSYDDRALRRVNKLLQGIRSRGEKSNGAGAVDFGDWARKQLRPIVDKFFRAVPGDQTDAAALHQFRIRGKKLRYAMELIPGVFPDEFRTRLYPTVETVQDRLGEINDLAMAKLHLQQKLDAVSEEDATAWQVLVDREQSQFVDKTKQFWSWCTPERLEELQKDFKAMLDKKRKVIKSNDLVETALL